MSFLQTIFEQLAALFVKKPTDPPQSTELPEVPAEAPLLPVASFFLTQDQIQKCLIVSGINPKIQSVMVAEALRTACIKFDISTKLQVAHLIAHLSHESMGFSRTVESMVYSQRRLAEVFGHRVTWGQAGELAGDEFATAEAVYGMRADLGNIHEGDGSAFRGHFFIQLTGRANHSKCASYFGITPEELLLKVDDLEWNCAVSCWYCTEFRRNFRVAADANNLIQSTQVVNGGQNGLQDRQTRLTAVLNTMETF